MPKFEATQQDPPPGDRPAPITWRANERPRPPSAVLATGPAAAALARRLGELPDPHLGRLAGVVGDGVVAIAGDEADLPWVEGARYFARVDGTAVLLPTTLDSSAPLVLVAKSLMDAARRAQPDLAPPVLIDPERSLCVPLGEALEIDRQRLAQALVQLDVPV